MGTVNWVTHPQLHWYKFEWFLCIQSVSPSTLSWLTPVQPSNKICMNSAMEALHTYEMVDNPSYTITNGKTLEAYSTIAEAPTSRIEPDAKTKTPSKANKCSVFALIAVCIVGFLACVSIAVALVTHFTSRGEDSQLSQNTIIIDMQTKITKLTQDLNITQSQLKEIVMGINQTVGIPGKKGSTDVPNFQGAGCYVSRSLL